MDSKKDQALISIISPAFNASATVSAAIESVQAQTFQQWEMLIGDDFSSDDTVRVVESFLHDPRIKLLRNDRNLGPAGTRNALLDQTQSRYIAFLDVDDSWLPEKLEKQLALLDRSDAVICCAGYRRQFENKAIDVIPPSTISYWDMLTSNKIPMLTVLVDREKSGEFHFQKKGHEDYQLWLDLMRRGNYAVTAPEVLAVYRAGAGGSVSGNKFKAASWHWNILGNEPISLIRRIFYFASYIIDGLRKNI